MLSDFYAAAKPKKEGSIFRYFILPPPASSSHNLKPEFNKPAERQKKFRTACVFASKPKAAPLLKSLMAKCCPLYFLDDGSGKRRRVQRGLNERLKPPKNGRS